MVCCQALLENNNFIFPTNDITVHLKTTKQVLYISIGGQPLPPNIHELTIKDSSVPLQEMSIGDIHPMLKILDTTKATLPEDFSTRVSRDGKDKI